MYKRKWSRGVSKTGGHKVHLHGGRVRREKEAEGGAVK